ncbi:chorismate mutase [Streptomyces brevispora]|uniref:Chorismate mutase n=1 Tax=Streptomyces brevispora TaxID=887462 RepID=A0ABZ1G1F9_9ACTN|nr:chorismate mutase [Streptomyces brevispora]WSC13201.1 chorismate mutase [Streptomyces brevispora]
MNDTTRAESRHESDSETLATEVQQRLVAEIDEAIIHLMRKRSAASAHLEQLRVAHGHPRKALSWENSVLRRYRGELGSTGTDLALLLLRML